MTISTDGAAQQQIRTPVPRCPPWHLCEHSGYASRQYDQTSFGSDPSLRALVGAVVDFARDGGVHGDGVVQAGARVAGQVLAVAVGPEDERLRHKHPIALRRVRQHLRAEVTEA